jgi:hypothetical protein
MTIDTSFLRPPPVGAPTIAPTSSGEGARSSPTTRIASLLALASIALVFGYALRLAQHALTDAWVAPLELSPDNEKIFDLRTRLSKEKADRARLDAELAGIDEEVRASDIAIERLRHLATRHQDALTWTTRAQGTEVSDLHVEIANLESQQTLLASLEADEKRLLAQSSTNRDKGMITDADYEREAAGVGQLQVSLRDSDLQLARARAALALASSRGEALWSASAGQHAGPVSPDVIKFDDDDVRIELEIVKLEAEKRSALARQSAGRAAAEDTDRLLKELQSRPLYRATLADTDLAFVPYEHLNRIVVGDDVFACTLSVFNCHATGTVSEVVPGEVITQDPWGELARGQYIVLSMRDRTALHERLLRVRRGRGA